MACNRIFLVWPPILGTIPCVPFVAHGGCDALPAADLGMKSALPATLRQFSAVAAHKTRRK